MTQILFIILALLAGVATAVQTGVNSHLRTELGNPFQAALISFAGGALVMAVISLPQGGQWDLNVWKTIPWWAFTGGLFGAYLVTALIILAPKLGASTLLGLALAGQMITALVLDHFGWLGFPQQKLSIPRAVGALFLIVGVVLIRKF